MRDFLSDENPESGGILCVFPVFRTAQMEEKIHCSSADGFFRVSYLKSIDNGNAHGAAGTGNLALSSLKRGAVQVRHLGLGDLGDLGPGDDRRY